MKRRRGQTVVEVVVILPLLLLFVLGLIQYALVLQAKQVVNAAAWRGARAAAVAADYDGWPGWDLLPRLQLAAVSVSSPVPPPPNVEKRIRAAARDLVPAEEQIHIEDLLSRVAYAIDQANLEVQRQHLTEIGPTGDPIPSVTVLVSFRFPLQLPLVDLLFDRIDGRVDRRMLLSSRCTLPVEPA